MTEADSHRVERVIRLVCERTDPAGLKVLDLACRVGLFSTALANLGCDVLGIEGRQENLDQVPPSSASYVLGDVRNLGRRRGLFDVTLCLGILYHLEPEASWRLLVAMRKCTTGFAIVDTHIGSDTYTIALDRQSYRGSWYEEPDGPWSSIRNARSWWYTDASLADAIRHSGWQNIAWIPGKGWPGEADDRRWLVIS